MARRRPWYRRLWLTVRGRSVAIPLSAALIVAALLVWASYLRFVRGFGWAPFTGFATKTIWDWFDLLIVPTILAVGGFAFSYLQDRRDQKRKEADQAVAQDGQWEAALQSYLDKMTDLLLEYKLRSPGATEEVRVVARSRTMATLRMLDADRGGTVIRFLYEAGLINDAAAPTVSLAGGDLTNADLHGAMLSGVNLARSDLTNADLTGVDLTGANLSEAILFDSKLNLADLSGS